MINALTIGHLTVTTKDLQKSVEYYAGVGGLMVSSSDSRSAHLVSRLGKLTVVLVQGEVSDCTGVAFEVAANADFGMLAKGLDDHGVSSQFRSDPFPGTPRALCFRDVNGVEIELYSEWDFIAPRRNVAGVGPLKLGHVAFYTTDIAKTVEFYQTVLGFRVSDWINDFFVFMRCNAEHHAVNFFRGPKTHVHHMAFELQDFSHIQRSCDLLAEARIPLTWGPVRQGPGHAVNAYHRSADDHLIEHYCEMDRMLSEEAGYFEPRPWHRDRPQRPKVWDLAAGISVWGYPPPPEHTRTPWGQAALPTERS